MLIPVILSGGAGVRLWPESRESQPKPFLKAGCNGQSLLVESVLRGLAVAKTTVPLIVTNEDYLFQSIDELARVDVTAEFLLEGAGRNTAPAVLLAACHLRDVYGPDAVMLVLAADHIISDDAAFASAVEVAQIEAKSGRLVTFGITPSRPETGYGYLKLGGEASPGVRNVERFVEKPSYELALSYVNSGGYLWNSGMFCLRVDVLISLAEVIAPELFNQVASAYSIREVGSEGQSRVIRFKKSSMMEIEAISMDYALMEKADNVVTVPCDVGWSDVGSWDSLWDISTKDSGGNVSLGDVFLMETTGSLVRSQDRMVATIGVRDLVIVDTPDALLVADKSRAQDVKAMVGRLKTSHPELCSIPRTVQRPWGSYAILAEGSHYKVKRIEVKKNGRLSLQKHSHRSEHWVVVSGTARVTNGDSILELHPNESTYIPVGNIHRLENIGIIPLVMIEVQSGEYLGEDDIVRLEDVYSRV